MPRLQLQPQDVAVGFVIIEDQDALIGQVDIFDLLLAVLLCILTLLK